MCERRLRDEKLGTLRLVAWWAHLWIGDLHTVETNSTAHRSLDLYPFPSENWTIESPRQMLMDHVSERRLPVCIRDSI